jgi:glycosyltransferase involved in cell wall biosynthesis
MFTVTVVIPHYNQPQYLDECLRSLLAQTLEDWEAIVVDDASTEGSAEEIISQLNDPRLSVIKHANNLGQGAARNTGFRASRAALILPLDADDWLAPSFLALTVEALQNHSDVDCVYAEFQLFGNSTNIWRFDLRSPREMLEEQWIPGSGTLMRKDLWASLGGYSENPELKGNEDWEFWINAVRHGITPMKIPLALYMYRRHPDSAMATSLPYRDYITREIIYRRHREFFDQHHAGTTFRAEGYLNSSIASLKVGHRMRAVSLALRGVLVDPQSS